MKINAVNDYTSFIEPDKLEEMPMVYQSIKGLVRDEAALKSNLVPQNKAVPRYRSGQLRYAPFYKNISKVYAK